jgi:hypothetical protein
MYSIFIYVHHPSCGCQGLKAFTPIPVATHVPAAARDERRDLYAENQIGDFYFGREC